MRWLFLLSFGLSTLQAFVPPDVQKNIEQHLASNGWPQLYYDVLPKVLQKYQFKTVLEVGVALGGHAETLLKNSSISTYYGVDPYRCYDPNDAFTLDIARYSSKSPQTNFDYLFEWVRDIRLAPYQSRVQLIRKPSVEASVSFENESLDCIFIDGDHRYAAVIEDLTAWYPKLRKGGLILGDDYWMEEVERAVEHYFSKKAEVFFLTSNSGYKIWAVKKT